MFSVEGGRKKEKIKEGMRNRRRNAATAGR